MNILNFYRTSEPSAFKVPADQIQKVYKRKRMQAFIAGTLGYALYYVCRLSMGVMKQPLIDAGLLNATQLGIIGACLYWSYAVGKLVNGFLCDSSNIKRFMATGLIVSATMNLIMGLLGVSALNGTIANSMLFTGFCVFWAINGWAQSMGAPPAIIALSRWFPLRVRGTYYGIFSSSHNIGEGLSFLFVGSIDEDTTESNGLPPVEVLVGEKTEKEYEAERAKLLAGAKDAKQAARQETKRLQAQVIKNPGVWILAISSALMYMSRYAINEWGTIFLQEAKGYDLAGAAAIIGINPIFGIIGTVVSGWLSDVIFKGDRKYPAFVAGILETIALAIFLFGGPAKWVNILAMVLFGIAIGVLISFLGGLMAVDLVPRKATGAALGIVGMASYAAAGLQNVITGLLLDGQSIVNEAGATIHDYTYVSWFWLGAATLSFLLPVLNWRRKQQVI